MDHEAGPHSEPFIELQNLGIADHTTSSAPSEQLTATSSWHPKLTGYRLMVIVLTVGFGLSKAILTYRGESIAPTTLEWVFSVVVFLL